MLTRPLTATIVLSLLTTALASAPTAAAEAPAFGPVPCAGGWIVGTRAYSGDSDITAVCASDTSRVIRLTSLAGPDIRPTVSPSGETLAFARLTGSAWSVWFLDLRTGVLSEMPKTHTSELPNMWKDDSTLVYAASQSSIYCWDSWTYDRATGAKYAVTNEGATSCESSGSAQWVPDQSKFYYTSEFSTDIRVRDASGAKLPPAVDYPECDEYPHFGWLRFSARETLAVHCVGPDELRFIDAKTFAPRYPHLPLTGAGTYAWSPDGSLLAIDLDGTGDYSLMEPATGLIVPFISMQAGEPIEWWGSTTSGLPTLDNIVQAIEADGADTRGFILVDGDATRAVIAAEGETLRSDLRADGNLTRVAVASENQATREHVSAEAVATRSETASSFSRMSEWIGGLFSQLTTVIAAEGETLRSDLRADGNLTRADVASESQATREYVSVEAAATRNETASGLSRLSEWIGGLFSQLTTVITAGFESLQVRLNYVDQELEDIQDELRVERGATPIGVQLQQVGPRTWYVFTTLHGEAVAADVAADNLTITPLNTSRGVYRLEAPPTTLDERAVVVLARNGTHSGSQLLVIGGIPPTGAPSAPETPSPPPATPTETVVLYEAEHVVPATNASTPDVPAYVRMRAYYLDDGRYHVEVQVGTLPPVAVAVPQEEGLPSLDLWLLALPAQEVNVGGASAMVRLSYSHESAAASCVEIAEACPPVAVSDGTWVLGDGPARTSLVAEASLELPNGERRTERVELPLAGQLIGAGA